MLCFVNVLRADEKKEKDYRIEKKDEGRDTIQNVRKGSLVFFSPDGKVIKKISLDYSVERLEFKEVKISDNGKYALYCEVLPKNELKMHTEDKYIMWTGEGLSGWAPYRITFFNNKGKVLWRKTYEVKFAEYAYDVDEVISGNGERVVLYYSEGVGYMKVKGHLIVLDTLGKEIVRIDTEDPLGCIGISNDGKIVGAKTSKNINGVYIRHLFFLDVETGRTKVVKAEGEGEGEKWKGGFGFYNNGQIRLYWIPIGEKYDKIPGGGEKMKVISFDELPEDLSSLFEKGGEK